MRSVSPLAWLGLGRAARRVSPPPPLRSVGLCAKVMSMSTTHTNKHTAAKNRSYGVRRELADLLGKKHGYDFTLPKHYLVDVEIDGEIVDAFLLSTTNAGFRGIEGRFELADGTRRTLSLGFITNTAA